MKEEPASPPHRCYARIDRPGSPPCRNWLEPILQYLGGRGGSSSSRAIVSAEDRASRLERCNTPRHSAYAKSDEASTWVCNDPDLAADWALDRSVTTRRCRRLDGELTKSSEEWSLSDTSANTDRGKTAARAPRPGSALIAASLRTA